MKWYHFAVKLLRYGHGVVLAALFCACAAPQLSEADLSDPGIKARMEEVLRAHKDLNLRFVTVDVHQKLLTISGLVESWEQRRKIDRLARQLKGPEAVVINLAIQE